MKYLVKFVNMVSEAKYLTDKSVFKSILALAGMIVFGVLLWIVAPKGHVAGLVAGLLFVLLGLSGIVVNVVLSCWYPVFSDVHVELKNYLLPWCRRVIPYGDILYAKVAEFSVRRWDRALVLTVKTKDGKISGYTLMTRLAQLGQLSDEIRSKGVPDTYDPQVVAGERKKYLSTGAMAIQLLCFAVVLAAFCWMAIEVSWPLIIVVAIMFVPLMIFQLNMLSYVVVDDRCIMLKYLILRRKNLQIFFDDAYDINMGSGGHFSAFLRSSDGTGKTRITRLVGLVSVNMSQEINAYLKSQDVQVPGPE